MAIFLVSYFNSIHQVGTTCRNPRRSASEKSPWRTPNQSPQTQVGTREDDGQDQPVPHPPAGVSEGWAGVKKNLNPIYIENTKLNQLNHEPNQVKTATKLHWKYKTKPIESSNQIEYKTSTNLQMSLQTRKHLEEES